MLLFRAVGLNLVHLVAESLWEVEDLAAAHYLLQRQDSALGVDRGGGSYHPLSLCLLSRSFTAPAAELATPSRA